jgi:choline dehydrogenase
MPTVTNGNIYSPVLMIGEKAADSILGNTPLEPENIDFYQNKKLTMEKIE